jgi:pimeloyl-ACP methyl ester carboxylesterase
MKKLITLLSLLIFCSAAFTQKQTSFSAEVKGKGGVVLMLPGFTCPGEVWNETIFNITSDYEYHIITYAGFGDVPPIEMPWYTTIKNDLLEYIDQEGLNGITLIGHSMGGNLAVDLAASIPDKVSRIILVDAIPCMRELMMPGVSADQIQYDSPYNAQVLNMNDDAFEQMAGMMVENMVSRQDKKELLKSWILNSDRETYVYGYTDLLKLDLRESLKAIAAPVLILGASFPDREMVMRNFSDQYYNLSHKTIMIAPDSKHFVMFDAPEWFYEKVNFEPGG